MLADRIFSPHTFANSSGATLLIEPHAYHRWRLQSEFFERIERPTIERYLSARVPSRILDVGAGTGLWTSTLNELYPAATAIGIDTDCEFLTFASTISTAGRVRLVPAAAESYAADEGFDLIAAAMSLDYIGVDRFITCIKRNLSGDGEAIAWIIAPDRYTRVGEEQCVKGWYIGDAFVHVTVEIISSAVVKRKCSNAGLTVQVCRQPFSLSDGIGRDLIVFLIAKPLPRF
jgi:cyclopropane fatty-acyl-phospholipid synthase-like methyltransferase